MPRVQYGDHLAYAGTRNMKNTKRLDEVRGLMQHMALCACVCQQLKLMKNYKSKCLGQLNNLTGL